MPLRKASREFFFHKHKYSRRTCCYCLADYVTLFNVKCSIHTPKSVNFIKNEERYVELPEDSYELDVIDDPYYNENESTIANEDKEEQFARDGSVLKKGKHQE